MTNFVVRITTDRKELRRWLRAAERLMLDYTLTTTLVEVTNILNQSQEVGAWELRLHWDGSNQAEDEEATA